MRVDDMQDEERYNNIGALLMLKNATGVISLIPDMYYSAVGQKASWFTEGLFGGVNICMNEYHLRLEKLDLDGYDSFWDIRNDEFDE